jgi:hypothetical protein
LEEGGHIREGFVPAFYKKKSYSGIHETFLVTVNTSFFGSGAPRTILGDRCDPFLGFAGSKNSSWRPLRPFYGVCGLQEPFLVTVTPPF